MIKNHIWNWGWYSRGLKWLTSKMSINRNKKNTLENHDCSFEVKFEYPINNFERVKKLWFMKTFEMKIKFCLKNLHLIYFIPSILVSVPYLECCLPLLLLNIHLKWCMLINLFTDSRNAFIKLLSPLCAYYLNVIV